MDVSKYTYNGRQDAVLDFRSSQPAHQDWVKGTVVVITDVGVWELCFMQPGKGDEWDHHCIDIVLHRNDELKPHGRTHPITAFGLRDGQALEFPKTDGEEQVHGRPATGTLIVLADRHPENLHEHLGRDHGVGGFGTTQENMRQLHEHLHKEGR